jgi:hypothetical protein
MDHLFVEFSSEFRKVALNSRFVFIASGKKQPHVRPTPKANIAHNTTAEAEESVNAP